MSNKKLDNLKDILVPQANPDAGEDLSDGSKEEREAYRFMKKIQRVQALKGDAALDGNLKTFASGVLKKDLRYIDAAIDLLNSANGKMIGVQLAKKSKDPYVQAYILAGLIKEQAEVKAAEAVIDGQVTTLATDLAADIYTLE